MAYFNPAYDGNVPRWRVRCGFVCQGVQCSVVGESAVNPEAPKAKRVKIFCSRHAREEGRTVKGRSKDLKRYVMSLPEEAKKRARAEAKSTLKVKKKKVDTPDDKRKASIRRWLGSSSFKECSAFHRNMILDELRVPPLLLGGSKDPTRVYLCDSFRLDDLRYLFEKRSDGRQLFLVRGSSIIR